MVRHGLPDFPGGKKMCLGLTDLPLSKRGRIQAENLGKYFKGIDLPVYSSTLTRAIETAAPIGKATALKSLSEMNMGEWDGLTFERIKSEYPELYEARGADPTLVPNGAETHEQAAERFFSTVSELGDAIVVAHCGVIQSFLCKITDTPYSEYRSFIIPYGSITVIEDMKPISIGIMPGCPDEEECLELFKKFKTPSHVIAHCRAVQKKALKMALELEKSGYILDKELISAASLLHDLRRTEHPHDILGAKTLRKCGYPRVADIIELHHDGVFTHIDEAAVVFLADKMVAEDVEITLEERFAASEKKCKTPEAIRAFTARKEQAYSAMKLFEQKIYKDIQELN